MPVGSCQLDLPSVERTPVCGSGPENTCPTSSCLMPLVVSNLRAADGRCRNLIQTVIGGGYCAGLRVCELFQFRRRLGFGAAADGTGRGEALAVTGAAADLMRPDTPSSYSSPPMETIGVVNRELDGSCTGIPRRPCGIQARCLGGRLSRQARL